MSTRLLSSIAKTQSLSTMASKSPIVAVLFQAIDPPIINGVRKPRKPGGRYYLSSPYVPSLLTVDRLPRLRRRHRLFPTEKWNHCGNPQSYTQPINPGGMVFS